MIISDTIHSLKYRNVGPSQIFLYGINYLCEFVDNILNYLSLI